MKRPHRVIGRKVRDARYSAGLTQWAAATATGVSSSYIAQVELGYYCPSIPVLVKLAGAYGTTVSVMLEGIR